MPPHKRTYFVDRSLGRVVVADALRAAIDPVHESIEIHDDLFHQDTDDDVWLRDVGRRGWVCLSKDDAIRRRNAPALIAISHYRVCLFVLSRQDLRGDEMGTTFVAALPRMRRVMAKYPPPLIGLVSPDGNVTSIMNDRDIVKWLREKHGIII